MVSPYLLSMVSPYLYPKIDSTLVRGGTVKELKKLTESAESGNARAQARLGMRYWSGTGVRCNKPKALEWLKMAA